MKNLRLVQAARLRLVKPGCSLMLWRDGQARVNWYSLHANLPTCSNLWTLDCKATQSVTQEWVTIRWTRMQQGVESCWKSLTIEMWTGKGQVSLPKPQPSSNRDDGYFFRLRYVSGALPFYILEISSICRIVLLIKAVGSCVSFDSVLLAFNTYAPRQLLQGATLFSWG